MTTADPLAELIEEYRRQCAIYDAKLSPEAMDGDEELMAATYGPALDRLRTDPPAPVTLQGALVGLEFAFGDMQDLADTPAAHRLAALCSPLLAPPAG